MYIMAVKDHEDIFMVPILLIRVYKGREIIVWILKTVDADWFAKYRIFHGRKNLKFHLLVLFSWVYWKNAEKI